jgi:uncharacterized protein (TIGR00730 family)
LGREWYLANQTMCVSPENQTGDALPKAVRPVEPLDGSRVQDAAERPLAEGSVGPSESTTIPHRIAELIQQIQETAARLAADRPSRGDLKLISRAVRELRYAFKVFSPYRKQRKVAMFGSARTPPEHPAYRQAVEFARQMADRGWLVITGAASGIMEAGHLGAGRECAMGLNILLPCEQQPNPVIAGDPKLVYMKYFFTRKLMFVKESNAICLLPGGFGTLDEGFEVLTLLQTGKRDIIPVVLLDQPGGDYWTNFHRFIDSELLERGMIDPDDRCLYRLVHRADDAVAEILGFYRAYHSMRYVRDKLVIRLNQPLSASLLAELNAEFRDLLREGEFQLTGPLPEEKSEPELAGLPRLTFCFNRRNYGRLRQLIDRLNRQ